MGHAYMATQHVSRCFPSVLFVVVQKLRLYRFPQTVRMAGVAYQSGAHAFLIGQQLGAVTILRCVVRARTLTQNVMDLGYAGTIKAV